MAFGYYSQVIVDHTKVGSSDQSNFTVLFNTTDARFKTVANGGHVQNSNGYDIRPYANIPLVTALSYELERYNASTGEVVMWIKFTSLSHTFDDFCYLYYGDSGITTDGSSTAAWDSSFIDVFHYKDGSTLSVATSTGSGNVMTNHGCTATSGQIDGASAFASASSQYITQTSSTFSGPTAINLSCWLKMTTHTTDYNTVLDWGVSTDTHAFFVKSNGKLFMTVTASSVVSYDGTGSNTLSDGTWYYINLTYNSTNGLKSYVNTSSDNTVTANGTLTTGSAFLQIGRQINGGARYFNGVIDEVHFANVARSVDWITAEYNNQNSPSTFYTLGTESGATTANSGFFGLM